MRILHNKTSNANSPTVPQSQWTHSSTLTPVVIHSVPLQRSHSSTRYLRSQSMHSCTQASFNALMVSAQNLALKTTAQQWRHEIHFVAYTQRYHGSDRTPWNNINIDTINFALVLNFIL